MRNPKFFAWLLIAFFIGPSFLQAQKATLPDAKDPVAGMGVDIHFTNPQPGELEMLARAGFRWVRMDIAWAATEKKPGEYDFSEYDRFLDALDKFHIRALIILCYGNPLYDHGAPPQTDEGRAAYAHWAAAAVAHFEGRGAIWEIWNEPNVDFFWQPHANASDYAKLALAASQAIQKMAPDEQVVGPALNGVRMDFVRVLAQAGVLNYWSAITIHPYRLRGPESYKIGYDRARELIDEYAASGNRPTVMCGESGYSCAWSGMTETLQAKYLSRLLLFDVMSGVPLTIWYDWCDDGLDPKNPEHNFGIVRHDYHTGNTRVYDAKPAYDAAQTYSGILAGYHYEGRMKTASGDDYVLSFTKFGAKCLVAWTASPTPHQVAIAVPDGIYIATSYDGKIQEEVASTGGVLILTLVDGPQYLRPQ